MKNGLIVGAALALLCGAGFIAGTSAQQDQGPENLVITDGTDISRNPAYFPHRYHQSRLKDCGICHHGRNEDGTQAKYEAGKTQHQKCNVCHNAGGVTLLGKIEGISSIQRAGHGRCWGCHREQKSSKNPPVMLMACPTCHTQK